MADVITFDYSELTLIVGGEKRINVNIRPFNPDNTEETLEWRSSNESIAKVLNGKIIGISEGNVVISAILGNLQANCEVTVKKDYKLVTLEEAKEKLAIDFDDKDEEISTNISSVVAYIEIATGLKEKDFANLDPHIESLAKDYVLKTLYFDYYDINSDLNNRRLTMIIKQLQLIGAKS